MLEKGAGPQDLWLLKDLIYQLHSCKTRLHLGQLDLTVQFLEQREDSLTDLPSLAELVQIVYKMISHY